MKRPKFIVLNDHGQEVELPARYVVCPRCEGSGIHDHPAFSNGIGAEEWNEDEDFRRDYMAGVYDVKCEECKGNRVVAEPVMESLTIHQCLWLQAHDDYKRVVAEEKRMRDRGIEF